MAIRAAGEARDEQAVPLLVDRLEDEDDAVRFFTILALEKITGERFGYDYAQPASKRARSVEQWRAYARKERQPATRQAAMRKEEASDEPDGGSFAPLEGEAR